MNDFEIRKAHPALIDLDAIASLLFDVAYGTLEPDPAEIRQAAEHLQQAAHDLAVDLTDLTREGALLEALPEGAAQLLSDLGTMPIKFYDVPCPPPGCARRPWPPYCG